MVTIMDIEKILMNEMDILRKELRHLKDCQIKYFLLSITSTITVIALATKFDKVSPYIFLTPLIVVLPCWWTFFDKASSITRIVGYYRILEQMLLHDGIHRYIGWERSLHKFRDYQDNNRFDSIKMIHANKTKQVLELLSLKTTHKYWMLNWYTFFSLVALSVTLSAISIACTTALLKSNIHFPVFLFVLILAIYSSIANFRKVIDLIFGHSSYTVNEKRWEYILRIDPSNKYIIQIIDTTLIG
jgi:hypothetical protein